MLLVSFPLISQTSKLDQKIVLTPGNRTIEAVLEEIEHITDLRFSYSSDLVPVDKTVSVTGTEQSVEAVLNQILKGLQVDYEVRTNLVLLKKKRGRKADHQFHDQRDS